MKKFILFISIIIFDSFFIYAQPAIEWQNSYGGSESDYSRSIIATTDGGYIIAGYTESNDSDVTNYHGNGDYWIVKIGDWGAIEWQKTLGGTDKEEANVIQQTSDGGYVIAGYSLSNDLDITNNHGQEDYWIVKLNSSGNIQWEKSFGGSNDERAYDITQTSNGGFVVVGFAKSIDGDVTGHHGGIAVQHDYWVVHLDSTGTILWKKCFGGGSGEIAQCVIETTDSCFIVAGQSNSSDGDVIGHHGTNVNCDIWIFKLNSAGTILWQKSIGGTLDDFANSIQQTSDGGFIIGGSSKSSDGDVTLHWGSFVDFDVWIVKLSNTGNIEWQKTFGGTRTDEANSITETTDDGFIFAGYTSSDDGDLTGLHGINFDYDEWIVKLNSTGTIEWQKLIGGTNNDIAYSILQSSDGGYMISGYTGSSNRDVTVNYGKGDFWVVELAPYNVSVAEIENPFTELNISQRNDQLSINFYSSKNEAAQLCLYDIRGKKVFEKNISVNEGINYNSFSCSDLAKGMYFVKIDCEKGSQSGKVFID